jgi:hypothetical protein
MKDVCFFCYDEFTRENPKVTENIIGCSCRFPIHEPCWSQWDIYQCPICHKKIDSFSEAEESEEEATEGATDAEEAAATDTEEAATTPPHFPQDNRIIIYGVAMFFNQRQIQQQYAKECLFYFTIIIPIILIIITLYSFYFRAYTIV